MQICLKCKLNGILTTRNNKWKFYRSYKIAPFMNDADVGKIIKERFCGIFIILCFTITFKNNNVPFRELKKAYKNCKGLIIQPLAFAF